MLYSHTEEDNDVIQIKIDIIPFGNEDERYNVETFNIINTGARKRRPEFGSYIVHHNNGSFLVNHHRRSNGIYALIKKVLREFLT